MKLEILTAAGLDLVAVLDTAAATAVAPGLAPLAERWPRLVLIGSSGRGLWAALQAALWLDGRPDPVDTWCEAAVGRWGDRELGDGWRPLWPNAEEHPIPVTALAELSGWSHRSRMGLGVHPRHGLWFAWRAVVVTDRPLELSRPVPTTSPCDACADAPCVSRCPGGATGGEAGMDIGLCFAERTRPGAACAHRCGARLACPVGADHRYSAAQIEHHHRSSEAWWARLADHERRRTLPEWGG